MKITNSISTCIIFFPFIIASAMEENNIKKNEKDYKKEKICFEIKVSSNVKKEDILSSSFWRDKIKTDGEVMVAFTICFSKTRISHRPAICQNQYHLHLFQ